MYCIFCSCFIPAEEPEPEVSAESSVPCLHGGVLIPEILYIHDKKSDVPILNPDFSLFSNDSAEFK